MAKKTAKKIASKNTDQKLGLDYMLCCDSVSRDPNSGKNTLYGVFDNFTVPTTPVSTKPFALFGKLRGSGDVKLELMLTTPDGKTTKIGEMERKFDKSGLAYLDAGVQLTLKDIGTHQLFLKGNGRKLGQPLELLVIKAGKK